MEKIVYIILSVLIGLNLYLIFKLRKFRDLRKNLDDKASEQQKKLSEAGNAITDTMKVIFDNLKNQGYKIDKLNKKETEYQSRFHKIESDLRRLAIEQEKLVDARNMEVKKYERNNSKTS